METEETFRTARTDVGLDSIRGNLREVERKSRTVALSVPGAESERMSECERERGGEREKKYVKSTALSPSSRRRK